MATEHFVKILSSLTTSSVWSEDSDTKVVWVTMLASADQDGYVGMSVLGLAKLAGVSVEATESALTKFLSPDPYSRTKDCEGRRIKETDRGWDLLNYKKVRSTRSTEERRAYERERKRKQREDDVPDVPKCPGDVPVSPGQSAQGEGEGEGEGDKRESICGVSPPKGSELAEQAIEYLNSKLGRNFDPKTKTTLAAFKSLARDQVTLADCRLVVDNRTEAWSRDEKMAKHLVPGTLFRPSNFHKYLDEARASEGALSLEEKRVRDHVWDEPLMSREESRAAYEQFVAEGGRLDTAS